ncbi:MAG: DUF1223 domain-containing protein, partial [Paracoccaceae bacterium]
MRRHLGSAACGLWIALAGIAAAQTPPVVVVELYTSQGCSSCPPADGYLAALAADPAILPLALHVDYWDYIGWADSFANPKFTERQKAYARAEGGKTIYTPQLIIGGEGRVVGHAPDEVAAHIRAQLERDRPVKLWLSREGDMLVIRAEADPPLGRAVRVQLVRYKPHEKVKIERGENAGHTITYHNIVTSWTRLEDWSGEGPLDMTAPAPGDQPIVVIVQDEG